MQALVHDNHQADGQHICTCRTSASRPLVLLSHDTKQEAGFEPGMSSNRRL